LQDEISSAVASALQVRLLDQDLDQGAIGGTTNPEAFDAYLLGVHYRNRGVHEAALRAAIDAFEKALELDPKFGWIGVG